MLQARHWPRRVAPHKLFLLLLLAGARSLAAVATHTGDFTAAMTLTAVRYGSADPALVTLELRGGPPSESETILGGAGTAVATVTLAGAGPGVFTLAPDGTLVGTGVGIGSGFTATGSTSATATVEPDAASVLASLDLSLLVGNLNPQPIEVDLELRYTYSGAAAIDSALTDRALARLLARVITVGLTPPLPADTLLEESAAEPIAAFPGVIVTTNPWLSGGDVVFLRTYSVPQQSVISNAVISLDSELFGLAFVEQGSAVAVPALELPALALLAAALGAAAWLKLRQARAGAHR